MRIFSAPVGSLAIHPCSEFRCGVFREWENYATICRVKVSVIIPCLRRDALVERAIESVRSSASGCLDLDLVVVEGVSPVGKARNEGLRRAEGDYIAWVDGDDEVTPDWGREIAAALVSRPDVVVVDAECIGWPFERRWGVKAGRVSAEWLMRDVSRDMGLGCNPFLYVTRRELWEGLLFAEDVRIGEDYLMAPRILSRARSCVYMGKALYRYYHTGGSLMDADGRTRTDLEQLHLFERRLCEAPEGFRPDLRIGAAIGCYWIAACAALDGTDLEQGKACEAWLRKNLGFLLGRMIVARGIGLRDRVKWGVKFILASYGWWGIVRWRKRHVLHQ